MAQTKKSFRAAVEGAPGLKDAWSPGIQALNNVDRRRVSVHDSNRLCGSVNLEAVLRTTLPNAPRWDYAIGYQPANRRVEVVYWVEVHPASDKEIKVVLKKLAWLREWLRTSAADLASLPRQFVWIASGRSSLSPSAPHAKQMALRGLLLSGRHFMIPNEFCD